MRRTREKTPDNYLDSLTHGRHDSRILGPEEPTFLRHDLSVHQDFELAETAGFDLRLDIQLLLEEVRHTGGAGNLVRSETASADGDGFHRAGPESF